MKLKLKDCLLDIDEIEKFYDSQNYGISAFDYERALLEAQLNSPKLKDYIEEQAEIAVKTFQETYTDIVLAQISE